MRIRLSSTVAATIIAAQTMLAIAEIESVDADRHIQDTVTRAEVVRQAVQEYCADRDECPRHLEDLLPRYLQAIPQPDLADGRWGYQRLDSNETNARVSKPLDLEIAPLNDETPRAEARDAFRLYLGQGEFADIGLIRDSARGCWKFIFGSNCWTP